MPTCARESSFVQIAMSSIERCARCSSTSMWYVFGERNPAWRGSDARRDGVPRLGGRRRAPRPPSLTTSGARTAAAQGCVPSTKLCGGCIRCVGRWLLWRRALASARRRVIGRRGTRHSGELKWDGAARRREARTNTESKKRRGLPKCDSSCWVCADCLPPACSARCSFQSGALAAPPRPTTPSDSTSRLSSCGPRSRAS